MTAGEYVRVVPPVISDVPVVDGVPGAVLEVEPRGFLLFRLEVGFRRDDRLHGLGGPLVFTLDLLRRRLVAAGAFFAFTLGLRLGLRGSRRLRLRGRGRGSPPPRAPPQSSVAAVPSPGPRLPPLRAGR